MVVGIFVYFARIGVIKMARTGRPIAEDPRAYKISARLTAKELEKFEAYARRQGISNAEVIKRGIWLQIESEEKRDEDNE